MTQPPTAPPAAMLTMPTVLDEYPHYQVARLFLEFFASVDDYLGQTFPNRLAEANIFLVIARTSLPDWIADGALRAPDVAAPNGIRVHSIARSIDRSPETLRRYTDWLVRNDYLVRTQAGLAVSPAPANVVRTIALYVRLHDLFLRFKSDVQRTTTTSPAVGDSTKRPGVFDILLRAMDAVLATLEPGHILPAEIISDSVWCAVNVFCTRAVTYDVALAREYANASVPDRLRIPVSATQVADHLQIPYATIWRKIQLLAGKGVLQRQGRGWIVPANILEVDAVQADFVRTAGYFLRKMRELETLGLVFGPEGPPYLDGPPPLAGGQMAIMRSGRA